MRQHRSRSVFEHVAKRSGLDTEPSFEPLAPADRPCNSLPGSAERIREYRRRLELGREMYHSDDKNAYGKLD